MAAVRVRFAPSPTGRLHLGNARTALVNFLFARSQGGSLVLRVEDTDAARSEAAFETEQRDRLAWLGLAFDEGPAEGGAFGPYRQSERLEIYKKYAGELLASGRAYPCYCSEEELEARRRQDLASGRPPRYSGQCRDLSPERRRELEAQGIRPALRFRVEPGLIVFRDLVHGRMEFKAEEIGDFIVVRQTGLPSYNFACAVDDHLMNISHVIRGQDHLGNTPRQVMLYNHFGWPAPLFAHHSLLLGPDRAKLSKRHGATRVGEFQEAGFLPEALVNYLAAVGGGLNSAPSEVLDLPGMIEHFRLEGLGRAPAVFDHQKLNWFNNQHLMRLAPEELVRRLLAWRPGLNLNQDDWLRRAASLARENSVNLAELAEWVQLLALGLPQIAPDTRFEPAGEVGAELAAARDEAIQVLRAALETLDDPDWLSQLPARTGLKGRKVFHPLRLALTGRAKGPQLHDLIALLTQDQTKSRLETALGLVLAESTT